MYPTAHRSLVALAAVKSVLNDVKFSPGSTAIDAHALRAHARALRETLAIAAAVPLPCAPPLHPLQGAGLQLIASLLACTSACREQPLQCCSASLFALRTASTQLELAKELSPSTCAALSREASALGMTIVNRLACAASGEAAIAARTLVEACSSLSASPHPAAGATLGALLRPIWAALSFWLLRDATRGDARCMLLIDSATAALREAAAAMGGAARHLAQGALAIALCDDACGIATVCRAIPRSDERPLVCERVERLRLAALRVFDAAGGAKL